MPQRWIDYNTNDNYWQSRKVFKKENKQVYEYLKTMGYSKYKKLIREINGKIAKHVIEDPLGIKLPYGMGNYSLMKRRSNIYSVIQKTKRFDERKINTKYRFVISNYTDWKMTKETGKRVLFMNDHSDGYKFIFHWDKKRTVFPNKDMYYIAMESKWNKYLYSWIVSGHQHYPILNPQTYTRRKLISKIKI